MGKKSKEKGGKKAKKENREKKGKKDKKSKSKSKEKKIKKKREFGFDVELNPNAQRPTEDDLKRFGPLSLEARQAHTAILLLDSKEDHILIESLNSLQRFCNKRLENRDLFVVLGGVNGIWRLLTNSHQIIQRLALKILAIVSEIHKTKLICRDREVIKDLMKFLISEDEVVVEYATVVAMNLATIYTGRIQIIQNECIPLLLSLTLHEDPDVKKNSVHAIFNLLQEPLHNDLFINQKTIATIYNLLESEYPPIQNIALSVFEKLTRRPPGVKALLDTAIIRYIEERIGDLEYGDLHRISLRILLNLATETSNCQRIARMVRQLTNLLNTSQDLEVLKLTVIILGRLSRLPFIATALLNNDIVPKLIQIVKKFADIEIREAATFAAGQISASNFNAKHHFIEILQPLIAFFFDKGATLVSYEYILLVMSIILEGGYEASQNFIQNGGLRILHNCINETNKKYTDDTKISAMTCINLISIHVTFRENMVKDGLVPALLLLMGNKNTQIMCAAANAVSSLISVKQAREEFLEYNGATYLIAALKHPEVNVINSMTPLITAIASFSDVAVGVVNNGILSSLWMRQDLISTNRQLSVAVDNIIAKHLPAKYAYIGHINPYENIPDGFYDAGVLNKDELFIPLEKMTFEGRQNYQKPIYINLNSITDPKLHEQNPILRELEKEGMPSVLSLANHIQSLIPTNVRSEKDLVGLIATIVSSKLGGPVEKWRVSAHTEEIELAEFQSKHKSVAIPLMLMRNGAHRPRALMFKVLADIFGIASSLDRGEFKKYWNVVLLRAKSRQTTCPVSENPNYVEQIYYTEKESQFVVDLLFAPGSLFLLNSQEANTYCFC